MMKLFLSAALLLATAAATLVCATPVPDYPPVFPQRERLETNQLPASSLPAPTCRFRMVVIGVGYQNYTCNPANPSAAPAVNGAMAKLYDATDLRLEDSVRAASIRAFDTHKTLLPEIGDHFFNAARQPVFNIFRNRQLRGRPQCFTGRLVARVPATTAVDPVPKADQAVDWLKLAAAPPSDRDFQEVYRVFTNGGKAPATCQGQPETVQSFYTTAYYFFG